MAKRKAKSKSKKSSKTNATLTFTLVALLIIGAVIYYLLNYQKRDLNPDQIKPIKQKTQKTLTKSVKKDSIKAEIADYNDSSKADSSKITSNEEKIISPKPIITEKGKYYSVDPKLPKVCIIVDDFGYIDGSLLDKFLELDSNIAFSILPGLKNSVSTMKKARQAGHEVLIHLPMEPESYPKADPGDNAIFVKMNDTEIKNRVSEYMSQLNLAIGANHHMGSKAAADPRVVSAVLDRLKENHLFYIDSYTDKNSVVEEIANLKHIPFARRNVFLDVPEASKHRAILKIEEMAKLKGSLIVVISHCHSDIKYRQLNFFIERLKDKHYQIIPASKAVRLKKTTV